MTKGQFAKIKKLYDQLNECLEKIQGIEDSLSGKLDRMSETARESEKGERRENSISELQDAITNLEAAMESLDNSTAGYEEYED